MELEMSFIYFQFVSVINDKYLPWLMDATLEDLKHFLLFTDNFELGQRTGKQS